MNGADFKKTQTERGITAQSTAKELAKLDKDVVKSNKSPKMSKRRVFSTTVEGAPSMARCNTIIFKKAKR